MEEHIYHHHKKNNYSVEKEHTIKGHCVKTKFLNSNFNAAVKKQNQIVEYFNFFIGKDESKWASNVKAFKNLVFENIYSNIDLDLSVQENGYKYDFIVNPTADVSQIEIKYEGAESVQLENQNLRIKTSINEIIELKPYAYQIINGEKIEVTCQFDLNDNIVSFSFPSSYDKDKTLIIDPFIVFSRYSGSFADNFGYTATYDSDENAYGAGSVFGPGFVTTTGAFEQVFAGNDTDVGIVKYSADGLQRLYSTYYGGSDTDLPHSLVVNSRDELYLLGTTSSLDLAMSFTFSPYSATFNSGNPVTFTGLGVNYTNGSDLFIARFSDDGSSLLSSSYLGGSDNDGLNNSSFIKYNYADEIRGEILIDDADNCYVVSCTESLDFPVIGGFQDTTGGGLDAVIVKMDENLTSVIWSTYLGGSSDDAAYSLDFDSLNNLIIAGGTHSDDFPLMNPYQAVYGGSSADGFIAKIHSSGAGLLNSTYYGSSAYDQIYFVELNDFDEVHIFGQTQAPSGDLISNAIYNKPNGGQMLAKFNYDFSNLTWATRFGDESGIPDISPTAFLVDVCNRIFLSGWGWSADSQLSGTSGLDVSADAEDSTTDNQDFYFMVLQDDASSLIYGSFFGGTQSREHVDGGTSRFDKKGIVYQAVCSGCGGNQDFPTVPSDSIGIWTNNSPNCNLGVVKYAFSPPSIIADFTIPPTDCAPINLDFLNTSQTAFDDTTQAEFIWVINTDTVNSYHLNYDFLVSGVYEITLIAIDTQSCNFQNEISKQITIIGNGSSNLPDIPLCEGQQVQIGISPLTEPNITYDWTPDYFLSDNSIANPFANPPIDTTYRLIISNGNCTDTLFQRVVLESIDAFIDPFDSICLESEISLHVTDFPGGIYLWEPEELITNGQGTSTATIYAENINQEVSVLVTNILGCTDFVTTNLQTINELPVVEVSADPDSLETGQSSQLLAVSLDATTYSWDTNAHFTTLNIENPLAENIIETTNFKITVDNGICPKRDSVTVYVIIPDCLEGRFYVPNAFSPNDDGNNDIFKVRTSLVNIENFYFAVYDRWGNKIFSTTDKTEGWDGTYKGEKLSPNVYGWYTEGVCPNGEDYFVKGNVTLLR